MKHIQDFNGFLNESNRDKVIDIFYDFSKGQMDEDIMADFVSSIKGKLSSKDLKHLEDIIDNYTEATADNTPGNYDADYAITNAIDDWHAALEDLYKRKIIK
jgi:hypothetical protein